MSEIYDTPEPINNPSEATLAAPTGSANWHDHQRRVALECFRIVQGPGDAGSEAEFNCRRETEQSGWMRLAARIIDSQNDGTQPRGTDAAERT